MQNKSTKINYGKYFDHYSNNPIICLAQDSRGEMSCLTHGMNNQLLADTALKSIRKRGLSDRELEDVKMEIDIMKQLDHPNIVKVFSLMANVSVCAPRAVHTADWRIWGDQG